ncbi:ImcF-related family protein [Caballeronia sp. GAWG1-1]|uniref:ImcF-related family protein n=1 Tax=Caballeronia sp. GAWG1-1 TaxID=2921742 RepID=UPI002028AA21|nr:ImcF-related family protein [Caballeronia sp. GAWG1-1]
MTTPQNNLQNMQPDAVASNPAPSRVAIWGMPLAALVLAIAALLLIWFGNGRFDIADGASRMRLLIGIPIGLVVIVIAHLFSVSTGAYAGAARLFRFETGDRTTTAKPLKHDARLQRVAEEMRVAHGRFWRSRLRWLMVDGSDTRVDQVAPGLKQAGVIHVDETVLVHAAPDGIAKEKWLGQIRRLRSRRPVDGLVHVANADEPDADLPRTLSLIATALGWAAPITFLHPVETEGRPSERFEAIGAFMPNESRRQAQHAAECVPDLLDHVQWRSADAGVSLHTREKAIWLMQISKYVCDHAARIATTLGTLASSNWLRAPLAGVMFAPVFPVPTVVPVPIPVGDEDANATPDQPADAPQVMTVTREQPAALLPVWKEIAARAPRYRGRRAGLYWRDAVAMAVLTGAVVWAVALVVSGLGNHALIKDAEATAWAALQAAPGSPQAMRAQLALQQQIETLEYRRDHGVPWHLRAGLARNDELLDALWQPYQTVAIRNLRDPSAHQLEATLTQLAQSRADALPSTEEQQHDYDALKTYLMLAQPQHADAAYLAKQLPTTWPAIAGMSAGEWLDTSQRLASFYASHLRAHPEWRLHASDDLTQAARNMLVNQIGLQNSDDTLYQSVLEQAKGKYADMSLVTLINGADARGLFTTTQTVPGIYTRAAWDGMIGEAIDKAAKEGRVAADWVLADERAARVPGAALEAHQDIEEVRQRLRARYFASYTAAWQAMLNSLQWQNATNLSSAITQLTRLTDAQTSPLIALMKSVQYQAQAGRPSQALSDTLVRKAQDLIGNKTGIASAQEVDPLDKSFGPLLALMGDDVVTGTASKSNGKPTKSVADFSGVSLAHFLTVATTMRLKLQQIATSTDAQAMARQMAQAVFQGKLSELTQARDDAALTAASLGSQWSGFGDALFSRPLDVAWQTILQPAAASLNEAWRLSIAAPFASSFNGHYPFSDTDADASFAELGRYIKPDTGLISRFVTTQLAGTLQPEGNAWAPNELAPQALQFDPEFLSALRQLSTLGAQLYAQGDASYRFQLMPHPNPDVTRNILSIDGAKIEYFNQLETYTSIEWPAIGQSGSSGQNGRVQLTWESLDAGARIAFAANGDWAWLRLLATAQVKPLDSTTYELTFNQGNGFPLQYDLKAQVGAGPLDLLKLRGFKMPQRVFLVGKGVMMPAGGLSLPPLPPEMRP